MTWEIFLGYIIFGFVLASIITGAIWLVVDFRRWSRANF